MSSQQLDGKVALVTGAAMGIGKGIAVAYAREGASVACADRDLEGAQGTVKGIEDDGGSELAVQVDVTDFPAVLGMFEATEDKFGGLDVLVAAAGVDADHGTIEDGDAAGWAATINVNLVGVYHCAKASVPYLRRRGGGKIIMIGSGNARRGSPRMSAYACSKAGLAMLRRVMSQEVWRDNIAVNEFIPGPVDTQMYRDRMGSQAMTAPHMEGEWIKTPNEAAPMAVYLAAMPDKGPTGQVFSLLRRDI